MRAFMLPAIAVFLLVAPALPVDAQAAGGTIYLTKDIVAAGTVGTSAPCTGVRYGATLAPPAASAVEKAYLDSSNPATTCRTYFDYTVTGPFTLSGMVTIDLFLACDSPGVTTNVRFRLFKNTDEIGNVDSHPLTPATITCTGPTTLTHITAEIDSAGTAFAAGDKLSVSFSVFATHSLGPGIPAGQNFFVAVGMPGGASSITAVGIPATAGGPASPQVLYETLTGESVSVAKSYANATSLVLHYNWTSSLAAGGVTFAATVANGTVEARVTDAAGKDLYDKVLTATATDEADFSAAAPGAWNITLTLTSFQGDVALTVAKPGGATGGPGPTTPPGGGGGTDTGTGTETGTGTGTGTGTTKPSPAFGAIGALCCATLALYSLRRTR